MNMFHSQYLVIPQPKEWQWQYLPVEFKAEAHIGNNLMQLRDARLYQFGILSSAMHMVWVKYAHGNPPTFISYPWPIHYTESQRKDIEVKAQRVLEIRANHITVKIEDLYNPYLMPDDLLTAHAELDAAVDGAYRKEPFTTLEERINFLLGLHDSITALWEGDIEEVIQLYTVPETGLKSLNAV